MFGSFVQLRCHQLDHEACTGFSIETVFHPHTPAVHSHVFVDERQAEPGTFAAGSSTGAAVAVCGTAAVSAIGAGWNPGSESDQARGAP